MSHKYLVAYFSHIGDTYNIGMVKEGNTQILAKYISNYLKADQYHIVGDNKYPTKYMDIIKQAKTEMNQKLRPKLVNPLNSIDQYDTIFIGYPIWYSKPPMAVYTFFESFDFTGKTGYLFCTHEGSGQAGTFSHIKNVLSKANVSTNGLSMKGTDTRNANAKQTVEAWLKKLKL